MYDCGRWAQGHRRWLHPAHAHGRLCKPRKALPMHYLLLSLLLLTVACATQLDCDFRLARVPPSSASKPSPVLRFRQSYPREVSSRSSTYESSNIDSQLSSSLRSTWTSDAWAANQTLGFLSKLDADVAAALGAERDATFGSLEGLYSIANTEQVAIVESTSGANPLLMSVARPPATFKNGIVVEGTKLDGALWDVAALSKVRKMRQQAQAAHQTRRLPLAAPRACTRAAYASPHMLSRHMSCSLPAPCLLPALAAPCARCSLRSLLPALADPTRPLLEPSRARPRLRSPDAPLHGVLWISWGSLV